MRTNNTFIILAVVLALLGAAVVWIRSRPGGSTAAAAPPGDASAPPPAASRDDTDFPPKPKWKPTVPVNIPRTIRTFAYYTDRKKAFAVFTHGTCVLLPDGSTDADKDAKQILDKVYQYHPDFNPQAMDDGNFLISYSQPAFSVVFKDEFEAHRDYIDRNHLDGVVRAEVLLNAKGEANKFDDGGKIGLFGRSRMFLDAQNPVVIEIWRP
jgi:hypothetical protein